MSQEAKGPIQPIRIDAQATVADAQALLRADAHTDTITGFRLNPDRTRAFIESLEIHVLKGDVQTGFDWHTVRFNNVQALPFEAFEYRKPSFKPQDSVFKEPTVAQLEISIREEMYLVGVITGIGQNGVRALPYHMYEDETFLVMIDKEGNSKKFPASCIKMAEPGHSITPLDLAEILLRSEPNRIIAL